MDTLPDELLVQIFVFINPDEAFKNALYVTSAWKEIIDSKSMWITWCRRYETLTGSLDLGEYRKPRKKKYKFKDGEHHVSSTSTDTPKITKLKSLWIQRRRIQHLWEHPSPPITTKQIKPHKKNTVYSVLYDGKSHVFFGLEPPQTTIEVWDVNGGQSTAPFDCAGTFVKSIDVSKHSDGCYVMGFSSNGTAAVVNRGSSNVFNVFTETWDNISDQSYHKFAFSNNSILGACGSHVQLWDSIALRPLHCYNHNSSVGEIASGGDLFVVHSRNGVLVWDIRTHKCVRKLENEGLRNLMFNGSHIVITQEISVFSSAVKMVDLRALGHVQKERSGKNSEWQMISFVQSIAHCLEGNKFTSAQRGKTHWWDLRTKKEHRDFLLPVPLITGMQTYGATVVCWSPNGAYVFDYSY